MGTEGPDGAPSPGHDVIETGRPKGCFHRGDGPAKHLRTLAGLPKLFDADLLEAPRVLTRRHRAGQSCLHARETGSVERAGYGRR